MKTRTAVPADLRQCVTLDPHYSTKHVWQMSRREENGAVMIDFRPVRLPRPMRVRYPHDPNHLWNDWRQWNHFLIAEDDGYVRGYLGLLVYPGENKGWIRDLVVGSAFRQQGVGTSLLRHAMHWATESKLGQVTVELQSKNYPAIRFLQKHGFQFCGFDESYYSNLDVALFFSIKLH